MVRQNNTLKYYALSTPCIVELTVVSLCVTSLTVLYALRHRTEMHSISAFLTWWPRPLTYDLGTWPKYPAQCRTHTQKKQNVKSITPSSDSGCKNRFLPFLSDSVRSWSLRTCLFGSNIVSYGHTAQYGTTHNQLSDSTTILSCKKTSSCLY